MAPEQLLRTVVQALQRADFKPLYDAIGDDVVWKSAATMKGFFRFGGQYTGREGIEELIKEVETDYIVRSITPKEIVSRDDVTWGLFWADLFYKPTSSQVCFDWAVRWRTRDGKLVEHQAFIDTAAVLVREQSGIPPR